MAGLVNSKPFKVCNADRGKQIGVTASTIDDVKEKVKKYYNVQHLTIVEESDGTLLEDEEYFKTLPDYTLLMALEDGQNWTKRQDVQLEIDQTDSMIQTDSMEDPLNAVARSIKKNPARIPLLTKHELQLLADANPEELAQITKRQASEVTALQGYCQRKLRDDDELKDGIELLRLYNHSLK